MDRSQPGFVRTYVLPALFLFALPLFAVWFSGHATSRYDANYREAALEEIRAARDLSLEERAERQKFFESVPVSTLCVLPDAQPSDEVCSDYRQFGWIRTASILSLILGVASVALVLLCSALSFVSRGAQYVSFVVGWNVLRITSSLQVVLQGGLAVLLSFWVTALWLERYSPKLIIVIGLLAALGVLNVVLAIFKRVGEPLEVQGILLRQQDAPELWQHIRELSGRLGTECPHQIIGGIDDNFFVTEGRVRVGGNVLQGRTLYVSLSLLRMMERGEADAVLAHEMAHFSGGDTAYSKKLSPLLNRYAAYLSALREGLARPVYYFMLFYWALFQLSLSRDSRQREYRADAVAAEITSPEEVAKALLRVNAYSSYRGRVEESLFSTSKKLGELAIPVRVAQEFGSYVRSERLLVDLHHSHFPHPFDSHPPLASRIEAVGARLAESEYPKILSRSVVSSWFDAITNGTEIEARLWSEYERLFADAHERSLAYRYRPKTEEERAIVEKYFPARSYELKKGSALKLDHEKMVTDKWSVRFEHIAKADVNERMFRKHLDLKLSPDAPQKKLSFCLNHLHVKSEEFLQIFQEYYGRHLAMEEYQNHQAANAETEVSGEA